METVATITWWGASGVELTSDGRCLLVDPYLQPQEPRANYICITRENYDHCHEPTIERLIAGPGFEKLLVAPSCLVMSKLDTPIQSGARDLAFVNPDQLVVMRPKYTRKPAKPQVGPTELTLDGFHVVAIESSESEPVDLLGTEFVGKRYKPADGRQWPAGNGPYVGVGLLPPLGFVITAMSSGLTFYHPGDLQEAFDSQRELRGQVDYMFLPTATLEGVELSVIDNVRPRCVIPIHYREERVDFPIPLNIRSESLTTTDLTKGRPKPWADPSVYRREIHAMMDSHWYATPLSPLDRIREITPAIEALGSEVLVVKAGKPHGLPAKVV